MRDTFKTCTDYNRRIETVKREREILCFKNTAGKYACTIVAAANTNVKTKPRALINRDFNRRARDSEAKNKVVYQTYSSFEEFNDMFLPLLGSWALIRAVEGRNDGLVPVRSQQWDKDLIASDGTSKPVRQHEFPLRADHLNQCGWWDLEEAALSFFGDNPLRQKENYERQIKNIYLEIANNLQNL